MWNPEDQPWVLLLREAQSLEVLKFMSHSAHCLFPMCFVSYMIFNICIAFTEKETNRKQI